MSHDKELNTPLENELEKKIEEKTKVDKDKLNQSIKDKKKVLSNNQIVKK